MSPPPCGPAPPAEAILCAQQRHPIVQAVGCPMRLPSRSASCASLRTLNRPCCHLLLYPAGALGPGPRESGAGMVYNARPRTAGFAVVLGLLLQLAACSVLVVVTRLGWEPGELLRPASAMRRQLMAWSGISGGVCCAGAPLELALRGSHKYGDWRVHPTATAIWGSGTSGALAAPGFRRHSALRAQLAPLPSRSLGRSGQRAGRRPHRRAPPR